MKAKLQQRLIKRQEEGTLRSLSLFSGVDFYSNDYLGCARIETPSTGQGSTGSRLISGNTEEAEQCERILATFFRSPSALVFNSGYDANVGFFGAVPQRDDVVLYDEHIHASARDGIRIGMAKSYRFEHNSVQDLRDRLKKTEADQVYVAIESLYSMGGDMAPLKELIDVCEEFGAHLVVDEAHAAGVYGEHGEGLIAALGLEDRVAARLITFGKAYGSHGAAILGSEVLKDYLVNFARSFIYTTALPPDAYKRIADMVGSPLLKELRETLFDNIQYFRVVANELGIELSSEINSPIQIIRMSAEATKRAADTLGKTYAVKAILPPTVAAGDECLRICLHAHNSQEDITGIVQHLHQYIHGNTAR